MMNTKDFRFLAISLVFISSSVLALPVETIRKYDMRYQLINGDDKLVDNRGDGFEDLYGVRNFRMVLRGLVYRGGANNSYNKYGKRPNMNPLPNIGTNNLCKEGFQNSIYLYATNFNTAPPQTDCKTHDNKDNSFQYLQITAFEDTNTDKYLKLVYERIQSETGGPIYLHCWNGWHASGVISALLLRQFCDYTGERALDYWIKNTDNHSDGYEELKKRIVEFKPVEKYKISKEDQSHICF